MVEVIEGVLGATVNHSCQFPKAGLDPHGLRGVHWSNEPEAIRAGTAKHGSSRRKAVHVKRTEVFVVAVADGRRIAKVPVVAGCGAVPSVGRTGDPEVTRVEGRGHLQWAACAGRARFIVYDGQVLGTVAEHRVGPVGHEFLGGRGQRHLRRLGFALVEGGRIERRERLRPSRFGPSHAAAELGDGVDGDLHEVQGSRHDTVTDARVLDPIYPLRNLLNRADGHASKIGGTDLGEEALHQEGDGVVVSDDYQRVGRCSPLLQEVHGQPKEPLAQGLQVVELLGHRGHGADLAGGLDEGYELGKLAGVLATLLQVRLNLLELLEGLLDDCKILLVRLVRLVVRGRRGRGSGEGAPLSNEVAELRLVLPGFHAVDDGGGTLHEMGPAPPICGLASVTVVRLAAVYLLTNP